MIVTAILAAAAEALAIPATRVDVGAGRRIALHCAGTGAPTIILTAGLGDDHQSWADIQPRLAAITRTCAWDRAGNGDSDNAVEPQDVTRTLGDLEAALNGARIVPPYILVGHSIGSFETLLFAFRRPGDVAGIVLVDPSSPHQLRKFTAASPRFGNYNSGRLADRNAQLRRCIALLRSGRDDPALCDGDMRIGTSGQRIGRAFSALTMTENLEVSSDVLDAARIPLGAKPLVVLTAGRRASPAPGLEAEVPKASAAWSAMHRELAALSSLGENRTVAGAAHYIHRQAPDAVVQAVEQVIAAARR